MNDINNIKTINKTKNAKVFLIDFENVHSDGISGIDMLTDEDEVVIFYSSNADSITFDMMHRLTSSYAKIRYYKVSRGGRNALDFQMSSYLGFLVNERNCDKTNFFLISRDAGFDFVIDFWLSGNVDVKPAIKRFFNIKAAITKPIKPIVLAEAAKPVEAAKPINPTETAKLVEVAKPIEPIESAETVNPVEVSKPVGAVEAPLVFDEKTADKVNALLESSGSLSELNNSLVKHFGQEKGVLIYKKIRPRFKAKPTNLAKPIENTTPSTPATLATSATSKQATKPINPKQATSLTKTPIVIDEETSEEIKRLITSAKSSHELYISIIKRFGREKGLEIYRNAKSSFKTTPKINPDNPNIQNPTNNHIT